MNNAKKMIHYPATADFPYTGKGIGIAFLDTGIFLHKDFTLPHNRIAAFNDFISYKTNPYDDNGHGTHICGIAAGNGLASGGLYAGIAPGAHLIIGKVLDAQGNGSVKSVEKGITWIINHTYDYNIRILNISIGAEDSIQARENTALLNAVENAWDSGLIVIVAAGNNGPGPMSVTVPGISHKVITVGAADDSELIDAYGHRITNYSGRGPTKNHVIKPDLLAPGSNIFSCASKKSLGQYTYTKRSGTSMSTPVVSGAAALLLEKHPRLTNTDIKRRLALSCDNLGYPATRQGHGLLNIHKLLYANDT